MTCAELEILLCDYVDGTLRGEERTALENHLAGCASCAELSKDVAGAVSLIERAAVVEPPAELLTRILHHAPIGRPSASDRKSWYRKLFGGMVESVLQPRYAMGMAMTILSISMLWKFSGMERRQLRPADLDPVKIWAAIDDNAHRAWDRTMKYYDNLRLVIEVESRLKELTDDQNPETSNPKSEVKK